MGLIEIAGLVNCVEDGDALFQEVRRVPGALDLTSRAVSDPRRLQKMTLHGSQGQRSRSTAHDRLDDRVA